nr:hypothetical protein [[Mycoplasma] falconis]
MFSKFAPLFKIANFNRSFNILPFFSSYSPGYSTAPEIDILLILIFSFLSS